MEGKTYFDISRMTSRNYRTIKKYVEMDEVGREILDLKINKGAKIGAIIHIILIITMIILIILNKPFPSVLAWIFGVGIVISLTGSLITLYKNKKNGIGL